MVLHKQGEIQCLGRPFNVLGSLGHEVVWGGNPNLRARLFHFDPSGFITLGAGPGIWHLAFFEFLNDFDARKVLVGRTVTKIEEKVVLAAVDKGLNLLHRVGFSRQSGHSPGGFRHEGTRVAWLIVLGKRIGIKVLSGQQTDLHGDDLKDPFSTPTKSKIAWPQSGIIPLCSTEIPRKFH